MLQYKQILKVTVSKYITVRLSLISTLKNDKITHTFTMHMLSASARLWRARGV
jgi:hypothetical protein